ncbi:MAG: SDR family NAD(P)-dependent oxidoreductase, partial [bacterium]
MELQNKVALVTGGVIRVGKAIALGLAKEGIRLALQYNHSSAAAQQTLSEVKSLGGEALLIQGDFSQISKIEHVVNTCFQHFRRIDILINNAAIYFKTPFGET